MKAETTLSIIEMILKYGPQAIFAISEAMKKKEDITKEDIQNLFITKDPEEYFKEAENVETVV